MHIKMPLLIKKFLDFINEEYELVTKLKAAAPGTKTLKIPYHLEDAAILALADHPKNSNIFAEIIVKGDNLCLEYGDSDGKHDVNYNFHDYDNVTQMITVAYEEWKQKVEDLHLSEDDVVIDEFSKNGL